MLQIACCLVREVLCGCAWCSTARAAPLPAHLSICCTCITHSSAACPGDTCTLTLSSWSSSSVWDTLPSRSWSMTLTDLDMHGVGGLVSLRPWPCFSLYFSHPSPVAHVLTSCNGFVATLAHAYSCHFIAFFFHVLAQRKHCLSEKREDKYRYTIRINTGTFRDKGPEMAKPCL